jgi:hypothetical protein
MKKPNKEEIVDKVSFIINAAAVISPIIAGNCFADAIEGTVGSISTGTFIGATAAGVAGLGVVLSRAGEKLGRKVYKFLLDRFNKKHCRDGKEADVIDIDYEELNEDENTHLLGQ